jgi:hypothetical protein
MTLFSGLFFNINNISHIDIINKLEYYSLLDNICGNLIMIRIGGKIGKIVKFDLLGLARSV